MRDSVRISIKTLVVLCTCTRSAFNTYIAILNHLSKNTYETKVDRSILIKDTNNSPSSMSKAIKELEEKQLIKVIAKDTYHIPINQCVKGNVNTIIQKEKELKEELAIMEQEKEARKRITEFSLKLRNKK